MNDLLGRTLVIRFDGRITCQYCGASRARATATATAIRASRRWRVATCAWSAPTAATTRPARVANRSGARASACSRTSCIWRTPPARRWASPRRPTCRCAGSTRARHRRSSSCARKAAFRPVASKRRCAQHVSDRTEWRNLVGRDAQRTGSRGAVRRSLRGAAARALAAAGRAFSRRACVGRSNRRRCSSNIRSTSYAGPPIGLTLEPGVADRRNVARHQGSVPDVRQRRVQRAPPYLVSCRSSAGGRHRARSDAAKWSSSDEGCTTESDPAVGISTAEPRDHRYATRVRSAATASRR